ncbi:MAG: hypothetical protein JRC93_08500 [Deltaproteobacteria bacterium]|nr:hypothetical protein [Deltaproteobacteria bacterium]
MLARQHNKGGHVTTNKWIRNQLTGPGGGLFTGPGGGMFTGPDSDPYMSNIPPWPVFVKYLFELGHTLEAEMISKYLK